MASWQDYLRRLRPAGVAGAAVAGVPADRESEARAELAPVFDLLDDTERELAAIAEAGAAEVAHRRDEAARQAAGIVATAETAAPAVRARAATTTDDHTDQEADDTVERIRRCAARAMPGLVERAVALALRDVVGGRR